MNLVSFKKNIIIINIDICFVFGVLLTVDTDGREDMKRIYGITAVDGRVRPGKGVKVLLSLFLFGLFRFFLMYYILKFGNKKMIRVKQKEINRD